MNDKVPMSMPPDLCAEEAIKYAAVAMYRMRQAESPEAAAGLGWAMVSTIRSLAFDFAKQIDKP